MSQSLVKQEKLVRAMGINNDLGFLVTLEALFKRPTIILTSTFMGV
jgi:hypothetical protein